MTPAEIVLALNAAIGLVTALTQALSQHPDTPEALKARLQDLLAAVRATGAALDAYRPIAEGERG